ncbi:endolytic transglycosylase MltG [Rhizobiaceae bacterium BDR2-2]|uniref:Endolytic murein transglycosylase n=1 Tax=Ectorhizobium quercum TaxID=2965071 RepID=A0AAE3N349_9HYPH|nr:endolytic transglycosylase MltG [Ectorhizobium quercum]MCX8999031.1 endolytic transglycosylase MltG [Ectorhizobium quercum]
MNETNDLNNDEPFREAQNAPKGPIIPKSPKEALRPERVPEPPRRSRKARSQFVIFLNFVMTMIVLGAAVAVGLFVYVNNAFREPGPLAVNTHVIVRAGSGTTEIAANLERNGVITDARIFQYMSKIYLGNRTLKAGEYEVKAGASMQEVVDLLESGRSILYSITFPEGLTVAQIFRRLADDPILEGNLPAETPAEGSLRPDTYKFSRGTRREEIVSQMLAQQARIVDQIWERRDPELPLKSKEELVVLASIVEKETGKADERAHVASVFYNRLARGMRLQSDPTVLYGIFGGEGRPSDRPIYQSDLDRETPYNTYRISALPPGPIANPGRDALEATALPWKTKDLYFVADGTGGHAFAETLEEHNANVRRWRRIQAEQAAGNTPPAATAPATSP